MENTVELIGHYGSDEVHALSAWTSTSRELDDAKRERIPGMLKSLAEAGHHTPFEKSSLHFLVTTDIASHIHIIKHRIAVPVNGESARYKEIKEDKFYLPKDWMNIQYGGIDAEYENHSWLQVLERYTQLGNRLYHDCVADLTPILGRKRAKESARFFKTYNSQITADVMFNWRSFHHFLGLRMDDHAQLEIHEVAKNMLQQVKQIPGNPFQHTIKAFGYE